MSSSSYNLDDVIRNSLVGSGGSLQRARMASDRPEPSADRSAADGAKSSILAERMLLLAGWGIISPNTAQWLCAGAVEDGRISEEVEKIGAWGTAGNFSGNCRRDMLRGLPKSRLMPRPLYLNVAITNKRKNIEVVTQSILNPLQVMQSMFEVYPRQFEQLFVPTSPWDFWNSVHPDDPRWTLLGDMRGRTNWKDRAIPFILHADGAQFTNKNRIL